MRRRIELGPANRINLMDRAERVRTLMNVRRDDDKARPDGSQKNVILSQDVSLELQDDRLTPSH